MSVTTTPPLSLEQFNAASTTDAAEALRQCCAAQDWIQAMVASRPYTDLHHLLHQADQHWANMDEANLLEAFSAHPQIGNVATLRAKYASTKALASGEQSAVSAADEATLQALAQGNQQYLDTFGFIFIVCATGKSAAEMLSLLQARLPNSRPQELVNAAEEQRKITALRLQKLFLE
ncbi:MAG: 2-oxo-4-hydroxy-4-carboxy-5-ureidoimidazoline decarboxylase [Pseudomonadota bacterium]|nr:2-oxo-4-hydroxy-4-carboxy-5-ureidoimidazoline decarboxylase [Pseudomonadota bacterium]